MGSSDPNAERRMRDANAKWEREERKRVNAKRMALAEKITMAVIDKINHDIIRPGPKPEERECYVMADELRQSSKELSVLIQDILKIEETEGDDNVR